MYALFKGCIFKKGTSVHPFKRVHFLKGYKSTFDLIKNGNRFLMDGGFVPGPKNKTDLTSSILTDEASRYN